jgi:signal peptidase I
MNDMSFLKGIIGFVMDMLETIVFVGAMFIVVNYYILQPSQVRGSSMLPTLHDNDRIFVSRVTYKLRKPQRGDIIVLNSPENKEIEFVKRVIGVPGDTVTIDNCKPPFRTECDLIVNDKTLDEKYVKEKTQLYENALYKEGEEITVPEDQLFVMGDNRTGSLDSRIFGPIRQDSIIGVVFFRYFPSDAVGMLKNPYTKN